MSDSKALFRRYFFMPVSFMFFLSLYQLFRTQNYNFDSILYARMVESGVDLFDTRHILQHHLQRIFYLACLKMGYVGDAIIPIQFLNSVFAALAVSLFYPLCKSITKNHRISAFSSLFLGFSSGFWRYSTSGEILILPVTLLIICLYLVFKAGKKNIMIAGAVFGLEVCMYQSHILYGPAIIAGILLRSNKRETRIKEAIYFFLNASTVILLIYGGVWQLFAGGKMNPLTWFLGMTTHSVWTGFTEKSISHAMHSAQTVLMHPGGIALAFWIILILVIFRDIYCNFGMAQTNRQEHVTSFLLILFFIPAQLYYNPGNDQQLIPMLIPLWILVSIGLADIIKGNRVIGLALPILILLMLFLTNFIFSVLPESRPENNLNLQRTLFIKENTKSTDLILITGFPPYSQDRQYIPYFAKREMTSFWDLYCCTKIERSFEYTLKKKINGTLWRGGNVYIHMPVVDERQPNWRIVNFVSPKNGLDMRKILDKEYVLEPSLNFNGEIFYRIQPKKLA